MSSRRLRSHILTVAVAVAVLTMSGTARLSLAGESPESGTSTLSASSGGCFPPSAAVDVYLEAVGVPGFVFNEPDTEDECAKVCKKFEKTCDDIAHNARVCGNHGGAKFASLLRTTCSTFEVKADRRLCQDDVNQVQKDVRNCTNDDRRHAGDCCDLWETEVCLSECLDDSFRVPHCFTGPGGFNGGSCWFHLFDDIDP